MIDLVRLPHAPGCYLFSDDAGTIIYVGKAKDCLLYTSDAADE